jgi:hypothetical protein
MATPETPKKRQKRAEIAREVTEAISKAKAAPKPTGRPSKYTPEIAQKMCELLSEGVPLREICRMEGMPYWRTVYLWIAKDESLSAHIARAREAGYDAMAEECLIIADTPKIGVKKTFNSGAGEEEDSMTVTEDDMLGHRKLQIETRLKLLAKWNPKKYGDRVQLAGDAENPLKLEVETQADKMMEALLANLEMKRQANGSN